MDGSDDVLVSVSNYLRVEFAVISPSQSLFTDATPLTEDNFY